MNLLPVEQVLRERLGMDPAAVGATTMARAVEARMRATGAVTPDAYYTRHLTPAEVTALAEEIAVPETWFFRGGRRLFDELAGFLARRASRSPGHPVRVLSMPCSTGEEPYSLAIAAHEYGLTPEKFRIDGVDLSAAHLDRAATASYSAGAFREPGSDPRSVHFRANNGRWEILPHLQRSVHFQRGNLAEPEFPAGRPRYDLILCRNLFIYLTPDGRSRAMANLDRLLASDGWLCVSPAEADRLPRHQFVAVGQPEWCLYQRATSPTMASGPRVPPPGRPPRSAISPPVVQRGTSPAASAAIAPPAATLLATARELADAGRLAEAKQACEEVLAAGSGPADGYALLGVIQLALDQPDAAAASFRKALYLEPDHPAALAHLIVLAERRNDAAQVVALRRRLARLETGETLT